MTGLPEIGEGKGLHKEGGSGYQVELQRLLIVQESEGEVLGFEL